MENKRTAIVVGGSSGIGCETCAKLVSRGWNVINISRTPCKISMIKNEIADVVAGSTLADVITRTGEAWRFATHASSAFAASSNPCS